MTKPIHSIKKQKQPKQQPTTKKNPNNQNNALCQHRHERVEAEPNGCLVQLQTRAQDGGSRRTSTHVNHLHAYAVCSACYAINRHIQSERIFLQMRWEFGDAFTTEESAGTRPHLLDKEVRVEVEITHKHGAAAVCLTGEDW